MKLKLNQMVGLIFIIALMLGSPWTAQSANIFGDRGVHLIDKGFEFNAGYHQIGAKVDNLAFRIRDVPPHDDDGGRGSYGHGEIERVEYDTNHGMNLAFLYGAEYGTGKDRPFRVNWALGLEWLINFDTSKQLRNYQGAIGTEKRGYGTALTYVRLRQGGAIPPISSTVGEIFLNWTPRAKIEIAPLGGAFKNIWFGGSVSYYSIYAQNGWDRYDSLSARKDYVLARVIPIRAYVTWLPFEDGDMRAGISGGLQFQPHSVTGIGKESEFSLDSSVFFISIVWKY